MKLKAIAAVCILLAATVPAHAGEHVLHFFSETGLVMKVWVKGGETGRIQGKRPHFSVSVSLPDGVCGGRIRFVGNARNIYELNGHNFCTETRAVAVGKTDGMRRQAYVPVP